MSCQSIAEFYAGKSVFITGGTGFLGKALIEKLLYSCSQIDKIYILVRGKKGVGADRRVQEITQQAVFTRIRNETPDDLKKIVPISGDISLPNLGIESEVENEFIDKVSVVFHVAATVKYNDPLDVALNVNVEGTRRVLDLCKRMKMIQRFLHVSTAYANPNQIEIVEEMYPPPATLSDVYKFIEQHGVNDRERIEKIMNGKPNTYVFTKALAEHVVHDNHGDIPTVIIRPSAVTAALHEPVSGWIDNRYGPTIFIISTAKGLNRVLYSSTDYMLDMIPVDYVTNLTIVAAAKCNDSEKVAIYNSCSGDCNPIKFKDIYDPISSDFTKTGFNNLPYPFLICTQNEWVLTSLTFLLQKLPALLADIYLKATGETPRFTEIQSKIITLRDTVKFFTCRSWLIRSEKARALSASLSPSDRKLFPFNPVEIDWGEYAKVYCQGIKTYLLKSKC